MIYHLYHIPGKKIGVTRDLNKRVTVVQGYKPGEYEVLDSSDDIEYISDMEIELQKSYGYKVDTNKYKDLHNQKLNEMKINITDQTTTFPIPRVQLSSWLMDNINLSWETSLGKFKINMKTINWILTNSKTSMYNDKRCYIYNKAFYEAFLDTDNNPKDISLNIFKKIRSWAKVRGLYEKGDSKTQYVKLQEEAGELAKALLKNDQPEVIDAIGDMVVVLTNLAHMRGLTIEECIHSAYEVINKRTGKMIDGTFVKDKELPQESMTQNIPIKYMKL